MNVLRNLANSVAFYSKFATLINFLKIRLVLSNKPSIFLGKTPNFWTFWEFLHFQWPCSATFQLFSDFEKKQEFFRKTIYVFSKKPKFRTFWDIFLIQVQSTSNWLLLAVSKKTQDFFWKTIFFKTKPIFQRFEKSYHFSCILQQIFIFGDLYKIKFFFEKPIYFFEYNQILKVSWSLAFSVAFYGKFATFSNFSEKKQIFSKNPPYFFIKKPKIWTFDNFRFLNAIVEQICYL